MSVERSNVAFIRPHQSECTDRKNAMWKVSCFADASYLERIFLKPQGGEIDLFEFMNGEYHGTG